ncbi:MAG: HupE/UreJ family protein [Akkermansiaceae bacterium]
MPRGKFFLRSFFWAYFLLIAHAQAHVVEQFYADYRQGSGVVVVNFDVAYAMPEVRDIPQAPQPKRTWLDEQSDDDHLLLIHEASLYLRSYIQFASDGKPIDYKITFPDFKQKPYPFIKLLNEGAYYTIELTPEITSETPAKLSLRIKDGNFPDLVIANDVAGKITFETVKPTMLLELDSISKPSHVATAPIKETHPEKTSFSTLQLIVLGFRHVIPDGLDHVLFIIGICLMANTIRQLLWQSLVFTLAHALSMALVISKLLPIYSYDISAYIEALIALSIAFIAIESIFFKTTLKWRCALIALFGFIHGLGFAGSLGSTLQFLSADHWIQPLIWANLGIEIAQAILVIACFSLLIYVRKTQSKQLEKSLRTITALTITSFGILWFIDRLP